MNAKTRNIPARPQQIKPRRKASICPTPSMMVSAPLLSVSSLTRASRPGAVGLVAEGFGAEETCNGVPHEHTWRRLGVSCMGTPYAPFPSTFVDHIEAQ